MGAAGHCSSPQKIKFASGDWLCNMLMSSKRKCSHSLARKFYGIFTYLLRDTYVLALAKLNHRWAIRCWYSVAGFVLGYGGLRFWSVLLLEDQSVIVSFYELMRRSRLQ